MSEEPLAYGCGCVWAFIPESRFPDPRPGKVGGWYLTLTCTNHNDVLEKMYADE